jgi:uncharacterized protein (TIGR00725 family)
MQMATHLPIVGVMGSGQAPTQHEHRAIELGSWLATQNVHLLTGGGGGLMETVCRAFCEMPERRGLVIGIIPSTEADPAVPKAGYPNRWVELPIYTHLPLSGRQGTEPLSRNHINVLSSNVIIALPGGDGTRSEIMLALKYKAGAVAVYLDDPSDIPQLPKEVPVYRKLPEVQNFIRSVLKI